MPLLGKFSGDAHGITVFVCSASVAPAIVYGVIMMSEGCLACDIVTTVGVLLVHVAVLV